MQTIARVTPEQLIGLLKQICEAIQVVHDAGLVHGDLTPRNILVDAQDRITITDFGFSQGATNSASPTLGGTGVLGGTLGFAAPEQIDPAFGSISIKTDIYAIGGMVHWFLFGQPINSQKVRSRSHTDSIKIERDLRTREVLAVPKFEPVTHDRRKIETDSELANYCHL